MQIAQVKVRYWLGDSWGEEEIYEIVDGKSEPEKGKINNQTLLAKALTNKKKGEIVELNFNNKYLVVDIIAEPEMFELISLCIDSYYNEIDSDLIELGWNLAKLLSKTIYVPKEIDDLKHMIVSAYLNLDDIKAALDWLEEIEKHKIDVSDITVKLKKILQLQRGISIENIEDTYLLNQLGKLHKEIKSYRKSLKIYERSLELNNQNKITLNSIGGLCRVMNKQNEGIDYYNTALQIQRNTFSFVGLGGIYRDLALYNKAEVSYKTALDIEKNNRFAHTGLGAVYFDQGKYKEGERHFLLGRDINQLFILHNEYYSQGLIEKSLECLKVILKIDPHNTRASYLSKRFVQCDFV